MYWMHHAWWNILCEFLVYSPAKANQEFQGLYKPDGSPAFPDGMAISAHNPANPWKQHIRTPRLVIIEFVLDQLPHIGTAGQLLYLSLVQNYAVEPSRLHHELIFFEIGDSHGLDVHAAHMSKIVEELKKMWVIYYIYFSSNSSTYYRNYDHVVVIVHTHSDDDTGDLWFCSHDTESQGPASTPISCVYIFSCLCLIILIFSLVLWYHHWHRHGGIYQGNEILSILPTCMWCSS